MGKFLHFTAVRFLLSLFTLLTVSLIVFTLMEMVPGTCAERYLAWKNTQGEQITVDDIAAEEKRIQKGDLVMLATFGAGFTWGATALRWVEVLPTDKGALLLWESGSAGRSELWVSRFGSSERHNSGRRACALSSLLQTRVFTCPGCSRPDTRCF